MGLPLVSKLGSAAETAELGLGLEALVSTWIIDGTFSSSAPDETKAEGVRRLARWAGAGGSGMDEGLWRENGIGR